MENTFPHQKSKMRPHTAVKKHTFGNILLLAVSFLVCILLLEILLRVYDPFGFRVKGNTIILPVHKRYTFHNDDTSFNKLESKIIHTKNSLGFRGPDTPSDFDNLLSLFAIGGSTTECLMLSDQHDWPHLTGEKLKPLFRNVWINNAGLDGHSTHGHYLLMQNNIARLRPKVVLFMIGVNDTDPYSAYFHDQSLLKKNTFKTIAACSTETVRWAIRGEFRRALNALYYLSVHVAEQSHLTAGILNLYRTIKARQQGLQHRCIDFSTLAYRTEPDVESDKKIKIFSNEVVPGFRSRLLRLIKLTKDAGIYPVLITQPALYGSGIDPDTGIDMNNIACNGNNGLTQWRILEILNDVTREVSKEEKIALIDLAHEMPKRSAYFYDFIHFTNIGSDIVARIIASGLTPVLEKQFPEYSKIVAP
ncbi:MAG: hypothetical protein FJ119_00430 [Deltaproteobacteria bacterium]|nr:hypothetical protein [Deltaproteobacteria bacterium]